MEQQQQPRSAGQQGDVVQPGNQPRSPGGPGGDVGNPAPAPGTHPDPLVHPGDVPDIQQDVIAGQTQTSKQDPTRPAGHAGRPDSQSVGGQGNAKPKP